MRLYFGNDRLCAQAEIRRTHVILEKYKHSKYNKTTHNYVIFSTLPISVIGGILFYILVYKTVVIPYALEGKFFYLINLL